MDYAGILKRAWDVTWRYKILWLFGFFAGAGSSYGGGSRYTTGNGSSVGTGSQQFGNLDPTQVTRALSQYGGVIVAAIGLAVVFGLLFAVIGIAARGGLIHLVNEGEEGREVRAGDGWRVGFSKWGRLFGIGFITALPVLVIIGIIGFMIAAAVVAGIRSGSSQGFSSAFGGAIAGGICFGGVLLLVAVFLGVVLGIVGELAMRYAVLKDMRIMESIKEGWHDLFGRRGAFMMFLVLVVVGIVFGIVMGIFQFMWAIAPFMLIIGIPVLLVVGAVYGAFQQAAWTIFFRRMTGMETAPAMAAGVPAAYPGGFPPAPPMAPAPPAPPAATDMQAPPAPYPPAPYPPAPPAPPQYAPPAPSAPPASEPPPAPTDV